MSDMETEKKQEEKKTEKIKKRTAWKNIIGGDILATDFFRRQTKLIVLIMVLVLFYVHNRYACQQQMIDIDKLKKDLIDIKYDALTRSSELMERSRQSRIEEYIATKESDLQTSTNPPYLIKDKEEK
ncbi:FtsL-like putative cell division protein [Bacteroides sp.]|uniref:FtsL-like putative cell division protein n=1 Tax=Bacteroides sp. TaxID=29523 RepID=UPI002614FAE0|nr:FtsL-like putative cell division protein [Bacteroides sp.]